MLLSSNPCNAQRKIVLLLLLAFIVAFQDNSFASGLMSLPSLHGNSCEWGITNAVTVNPALM